MISISERQYIKITNLGICPFPPDVWRFGRVFEERFVQFTLRCHGESVLQNHTPSFKTTLSYKSVLEHQILSFDFVSPCFVWKSGMSSNVFIMNQ